MMKKLIYNHLSVLLLFIAALYFGYKAFFTMDLPTALMTLGFVTLGGLGREIQKRIPD